MWSATEIILLLLFFCLLRPSHFSSPLYSSSSDASGAGCDDHLPAVSSFADKNVTAAPMANTISRDVLRMQSLHRRITESRSRSVIQPDIAQMQAASLTAEIEPQFPGTLVAEVKSGISLGLAEYVVDVLVGTPPRRAFLILDTGSDLIWMQCRPCRGCFEQRGPVFDPAASSSYANVSCADSRCGLVTPPNQPRRCSAAGVRGRSCPYFYWYGDGSSTTGDLAVESFTMSDRVDGFVFGCGRRNRGRFHGVAGVLGLGRGPLSFPSQLGSRYGRTFSYCLIDRNSDLSVSGKLIFGEDKNLPSRRDLNYTSLVSGKGAAGETFYYVQIKSIVVDGEVLLIPPETWELAEDGSGGTIIDSGATLSYFAGRAYEEIKKAFVRKVKRYPAVEVALPGPQQLQLCYDVSGEVGRLEMPELDIEFGDGARWNFPAENWFIRLPWAEEIACLAVQPTTQAFSILGNQQQQNFHVVFDMKNSRLGVAPARCAEMQQADG